jgi:hypothetical protein
MISRGSVTLALALGLLGVFVFGLLVGGMPKPLDPGGAGIVTVGTSCFFTSVWAVIVWFKLHNTSIAIKKITNEKLTFFPIIYPCLVKIN